LSGAGKLSGELPEEVTVSCFLWRYEVRTFFSRSRKSLQNCRF